MGLELGIWIGDRDQGSGDWDWGLELWIEIREWGIGGWTLGIVDCESGSGLGIGIGIGDLDWELEWGIIIGDRYWHSGS